MDHDKLTKELIRDEGLRLKPYKDSLGFLTIGVGRCLDKIGLSSEEAVWLFNADQRRIWRGLQDGISEAEAAMLLQNDVEREWGALRKHHPWVDQLDEVRQRVLANMAFNLGVDAPGHLLTFTSVLEAIRTGRYADAAALMQKTLWAKQVGDRAVRLAAMMLQGTPTEGVTT
jgi:lysozyme